MKLNVTYKKDLHQEELEVAWVDIDTDQCIDYIISYEENGQIEKGGSIKISDLYAFAVQLVEL